MTMTTYDPIGVEPAPAPILGRRNVLLVGTLVAIAAGTMLIGALLGGYFNARDIARAANKPWVPDGTSIPNVGLFVDIIGLVLSAFTARWTLYAIKIDDRRQAYLAVGSTIGLGLLFINGQSFCWGELGVGASSSTWATHMYAVTVVHLLIVIAAIVMFLVMGFRVFGGALTARNIEPMTAAVWFWHFAVVSGIAVWWFVWFLEGGP
jgi:heme/copper-type cytochrome/quinol oxidase subunit 3